MSPFSRPIGHLLRQAQITDPQDIVETLSASVKGFGGADVVLFVTDYDNRQLRPHPDVLEHGEDPRIADIESSMAGRTFLTGEPLGVEREDGWQCWVPVTERAERLGVLALTMPKWDEETKQICIELGIAAAHLITSARQYTDLHSQLRRREHMSLPAEIQWSILPPLAFALDGMTVSGLLEPAYEVGGDCFDYSLNNDVLDCVVFDAMGHGLSSAMLATLAVSAYRRARRIHKQGDLQSLLTYVDEIIYEQYHGDAFVTALAGQLQVKTGEFRWISAGHAPPVHLRKNAALAEVIPDNAIQPLGLRSMFDIDSQLEITTTMLEPGDSMLLYTDGVVEARDKSGEFFGRERLVDFVERESLSGRKPEEVLRRLVQAVLSHQTERLQDDASMLYLHWDRSS